MAEIAEKAGAAMLFVRHWRKASGSALNKGSGLVDIGATARSVVMFARDKDDPGLHYMGHARATGFGSRCRPSSFVSTAIRSLSCSGRDKRPDPRRSGWEDGEKSALDEAKEFLKEYLKDGPKLR